MVRKPSDITQYKIRVREDLRRRLEQAAKKRDVSINFEMADRLRASFELPPLSRITAGLENVYARFARETEAHLQQEDLMTAAEALISRLPAETRERKEVKTAVEQVEKAIAVIAARVGRTLIHEPWE